MQKARSFSIGFLTLISFIFIFPLANIFPQPQVAWLEGPRIVDLGDSIASVELGENYVFANADDTRKLMESIGNPSTKREVGLIMPQTQNASWFVVFEYFPVGYIKDTEKDHIDADAILKAIQKGTERANKIREEKGFSALKIAGWYEKPHYDTRSNNLVWALLAESSRGQVANYNVRMLGRHGYTSATLVADPTTLDSIKPELQSILNNFSYKKGKSYAEYLKGDKVAEYGLTALIAGGAGAATAKFGLLKFLAKSWKLVAALGMAILGVIWKIIKALTGRNTETVKMKQPMRPSNIGKVTGH
jgi:uncharacterized membrane-anchored protein